MKFVYVTVAVWLLQGWYFTKMNSILYVSLITFQFSAVFFNFLSNFPIIFGNVLFYVEELNYNKDYVKVKCEARGGKTLFILH